MELSGNPPYVCKLFWTSPPNSQHEVDYQLELCAFKYNNS